MIDTGPTDTVLGFIAKLIIAAIILSWIVGGKQPPRPPTSSVL